MENVSTPVENNALAPISSPKSLVKPKNKKMLVVGIIAALLVLAMLAVGLIVLLNKGRESIMTNTVSENSNTPTNETNNTDTNTTNSEEATELYKDYLLRNITGNFEWTKNDVTGNTMNTYELNLVLDKDQTTNYDTFTKAEANIKDFLTKNEWIRTVNNVEGNASVTEVYRHPITSERTITIKEHATVGAPSLTVIFNYLPSDTIPVDTQSNFKLYTDSKLKYSLMIPVTITGKDHDYGTPNITSYDVDLNKSTVPNFYGFITGVKDQEVYVNGKYETNTSFSVFADEMVTHFCSIQANSCTKTISKVAFVSDSGIKGYKYILEYSDTINRTTYNVGPFYAFDIATFTNGGPRALLMNFYNFSGTAKAVPTDQSEFDTVAKSLKF